MKFLINVLKSTSKFILKLIFKCLKKLAKWLVVARLPIFCVLATWAVILGYLSWQQVGYTASGCVLTLMSCLIEECV